MKNKLKLIAVPFIVLWIIGCAGTHSWDYSNLFDQKAISISIREFSKEETDDDYTGKSINLEYDLPAEIEKNLRRSGKFSRVEMISKTDMPATDLVVEGGYKSISRFGFTLSVEGKVIRVRDKKLLAIFEHKRHSVKGMKNIIEELAGNIADFIEDPIQNRTKIDMVKGGFMFSN